MIITVTPSASGRANEFTLEISDAARAQLRKKFEEAPGYDPNKPPVSDAEIIVMHFLKGLTPLTQSA